MQPLNYLEIESLCSRLNELSGSTLQSITGQASHLYLLFWDGKKSHIWFLDLWQKCPVFLPFTGKAPKKSQYKPWSLFLKSHFLGSTFLSAQPTGPKERCIEMIFNSSEQLEPQQITLRLFPGGVNLILSSKSKTVSYLKPKLLSVMTSVSGDLKARSVEELVEQYKKKSEKKKVSSPTKNPEELLQSQILRKEKSIKKIEEELILKKQKIDGFSQLGEFLKSHLTEDIPPALKVFYEAQKNRFENMQQAFEASKKERRKLIGTKERLDKIRAEREELVAVQDPSSWYKKIKVRQLGPSPLKIKKKSSLKFKTVQLGADFKLFLGNSAKDNAELIKSSKPWYVWLHLRDYPSSHGVIISDKKKPPSYQTLQLAGEELINATFGAKKKKFIGIKFDVIYCEIRHLKLLKGSVGKVTYTQNKNLTVLCK